VRDTSRTSYKKSNKCFYAFRKQTGPVRGPTKATVILQPNKVVFERAILGLIGMFNGDLISGTIRVFF
jgi:hypothetical protein